MVRGGKRGEEVGRGGKMEELFEKADWLCYTCFDQEIADGQARRGGRLLRANLRANERLCFGFATHAFIKKLKMDELVEEEGQSEGQ